MKKSITTVKQGEGREKSQTNWDKLDTMRDEDIDYSDIPAFDDEFLQSVEVHVTKGKKQIALRVDTDVLDWMKSQGKGYQSRINAILRAYYDAHHDHPRS